KRCIWMLVAVFPQQRERGVPCSFRLPCISHEICAFAHVGVPPLKKKLEFTCADALISTTLSQDVRCAWAYLSLQATPKDANGFPPRSEHLDSLRAAKPFARPDRWHPEAHAHAQRGQEPHRGRARPPLERSQVFYRPRSGGECRAVAARLYGRVRC